MELEQMLENLELVQLAIIVQLEQLILYLALQEDSPQLVD